MTKRISQVTGKEGELAVMGELLKHGFKVYVPMVDVGGIDCIIKSASGYKEIQVKTRSEQSKHVLFDVATLPKGLKTYIICYSQKEPNDYWIIPTPVFRRYAHYLKDYNRHRLILGNEGSRIRQKLQKYRNNFGQLK
jgi:hypothetical protein